MDVFLFCWQDASVAGSHLAMCSFLLVLQDANVAGIALDTDMCSLERELPRGDACASSGSSDMDIAGFWPPERRNRVPPNAWGLLCFLLSPQNQTAPLNPRSRARSALPLT